MDPKYQKIKDTQIFSQSFSKSSDLFRTQGTKQQRSKIQHESFHRSKELFLSPYPPFPTKLWHFLRHGKRRTVRLCGGWAKILKVHRVYRAGNDLRRSSASDLSKDTRNLQCIGPSLVRSLTLRFTPT